MQACWQAQGRNAILNSNKKLILVAVLTPPLSLSGRLGKFLIRG
jgi:hypothetical protein